MRPNIKDYRANYQKAFSSSNDPYEYAESHQLELEEKLEGAEELVKAFPDNRNEHEALLSILLESEAMWEECEKRLRGIAATKTTDREKIARQINSSHSYAEDYKSKAFNAIREMSRNTSLLHKEKSSIRNAGEAMKSTGDSMQSIGHKMTSGCTIPIIVTIVLLLLLFLIIL